MACGQRWVTDETNTGDDYARNRLRHAALPALGSVNEAAEENLARFCEKAARADAYFARQAAILLEEAGQRLPPKLPAGARYAREAGEGVWALEPLQKADPLILETALHSLTAPVRDAEEKYIRLLAALVRRGSGAVQLTGTIRFHAGEGTFWREKTPDACPKNTGFYEPFFPTDGAEYPLPGGQKLKIRVVPAPFEEKTQGVHKKDLKNQADYAKITTLYPALVLRCRQPGDRFHPAGRGVGKELRKWMNEAGIPPRQRAGLPLLAAGSEVLWVHGTGFAAGLAPDTGSTLVLQLELQTMEEVES